MVETWKQIDLFPEYQVSNLGRIRNTKRNKILLGSLNKDKYIQVSLFTGGQISVKFVHILVCVAFHGSKPFPSAFALHKDDNRTNNTDSNLYWGTHQDNMNDMKNNGRTTAKINLDIARNIRQLKKEQKRTNASLAAQFGISKSLVSNVILNKLWQE